MCLFLSGDSVPLTLPRDEPHDIGIVKIVVVLLPYAYDFKAEFDVHTDGSDIGRLDFEGDFVHS